MSVRSTIKTTLKKFDKDYVRGRDNFNKKYFKNCIIDELNINDREVLTIYHKDAININIIFLHGGAYVEEALFAHRLFINNIIDNYHVKVTYVDYPLAPESNYLSTHKMLLNTYKKILKNYPKDKIYLMGDSSGGGLALSFLQRLNELGLDKPRKCVLLSPWVDVSMSNPDINDYIDKDPTLILSNLIKEGLLYAKGTNTKDYLVSPLYGKMNDLGNIMIVASGNEMLLPDIKKCYKQLNKAKGSYPELIVEKGMFHDFALAPINKSKKILKNIMEFLIYDKKKKRIPLKDRELPNYTRGEEIANMITHIIGGVIGIASLVLCVIFASRNRNVYGVVASSIFGSSMILLYTISSIYHGLHKDKMAKKVFQVLDHCTIFLLIAGTYTPLVLCTVRSYSNALGWVIFGFIWLSAIIGIILNSIDLKRYKLFSLICYLVMGWCIILTANRLFSMLGNMGSLLLIGGGLFYSLGVIFYNIGTKKKYYHTIFHFCCDIGSILQALCILLYVI